nr:PilZ domain-containing protein [uncultured Holophaga sp.]
MALFSFGKEKRDGESTETVLAYLEDAQRVRAQVTVLDARKKSVQALIQGVNDSESTATLQLLGPLPGLEKGAKVELVFQADSLRIGGATKILELRAPTLVVELPETLQLMERRRTPRARLNPKEGATLTALTSLFEGVGFTGLLENISEGGCRVRVEKAMNIKDQKPLPQSEALFPVGHAFMLLKLNKVPKCTQVMEMAGKVAYLESGAGGLLVGLAFEKPRADLAAMIRNLVGSRTTTPPSTLPSKARRKQENGIERLGSEGPSAPSSRPVETARPFPPAPPPAPAEAQVEGSPAAPPEPQPEAPPRNLALIRLKKRSRAVVAQVSDPGHAEGLKGFLEAQGFGRVLMAPGLGELRELLRQPNLGVLLLDCELSFMDLLEEVRSLMDEFHNLPPIILAAEEVSRGTVLAAHRVGVSQLLVKPYALDEAFNSTLEDLLE